MPTSPSSSSERTTAGNIDRQPEEGIAHEVVRGFVFLCDVVEGENGKTLRQTEAVMQADACDAHIRITHLALDKIVPSCLIRIFPVREKNQEGGVPGQDIVIAHGENRLLLNVKNASRRKMRAWLLEQLQTKRA